MRIGITGNMRRGKTTVAKYLISNYDFVRVGFADRLKEIVRDLRPDLYVPHDSNMLAKPRKELQDFGQYTKQALGRDVWVNYALRHIAHYEDKAQMAGVPCNIVIDDLRFVFEADALRANGFVIISVSGTPRGEVSNETHVSEIEVKDIVADYYITNNGTLDELYKQVDAIANALKITSGI